MAVIMTGVPMAAVDTTIVVLALPEIQLRRRPGCCTTGPSGRGGGWTCPA
jgi:hypothetical protein